jgi:hypothetical protein
LRHQQPTHGKLEDRPLQRIHRLRPIQQQIEMLGHALPVDGQFLGRGAVGQRAEQGVEQASVLRGFEPALGFEGIAKAHQFVDAGDDAGLLGERWDRDREAKQLA